MSEAQRIPPERLRAFFHPQSIALIGATDRSGWSLNVFNNLKAFSRGPLYCVNPKYETIHGEPAIKSLQDLPAPVDLAYIMAPTAQVYPIVEGAALAGIRNLVILTAGFSETGAEGARLEQRLLALAQDRDVLLLGPNGNGFINAVAQAVPYGLPVTPPLVGGPVGVVLQSGALASAVLTFAQAHAIGVSLLVSMGNETMISTTDIIDYLIEDEQTRVIALFLESIRRPDELRRVAEKALERQKPIIALKIGRSPISAQTALAHTGGLVGDNIVNDAAFRQLGIIRVNSLEDLLVTAGLMGYTGPLRGRRMGVVTPSGGACDILSDRAQEERITLPEFAPATVEQLQALLPPFSTVHNPIDVTGYVVIDRLLMQRALDIVIKDPNFDFIVCLVEPPRVEPAQLEPLLERFDLLGKTVSEASLPVIVLANTCVDLTAFGRSIASRTGIHFVGGMEHGMTALGNALWWSERCRAAQKSGKYPASSLAAPSLKASRDGATVGAWSESQARNLLQRHDIPVVPGVLAADADAAVSAAQALGFPAVLKIQSSAIVHKTDVGGVLLDLRSTDEIRQGFQTLMETAQARFPAATIDGVLVSPMRPPGTELLVGILRDQLWGLVLAVGLGGIWTEVFKDTSVRILPVNRDEIITMIEELRGAAVLQGTRGQPPVDKEALADVIFQVSQLALGLQDHLAALEINPLLVSNTMIEALDALVTWKD
ncbi:MAG TPA: acetate--CoA ligase family protein [Ktedonobacterales bacterium]|jgi:acyl-CoA synthetase (NDP forming)